MILNYLTYVVIVTKKQNISWDKKWKQDFVSTQDRFMIVLMSVRWLKLRHSWGDRKVFKWLREVWSQTDRPDVCINCLNRRIDFCPNFHFAPVSLTPARGVSCILMLLCFYHSLPVTFTLKTRVHTNINILNNIYSPSCSLFLFQVNGKPLFLKKIKCTIFNDFNGFQCQWFWVPVYLRCIMGLSKCT